MNNINKLGALKALSGPIESGDLSTIKKHISSLKKNKGDSKGFDGIYLSYMIQSLNLLNIVKSKYKRLSKEHLHLQNYLLDELKKYITFLLN